MACREPGGSLPAGVALRAAALGCSLVPPRTIEGFAGAAHLGATIVLDWVEGEDLHSGKTIWIPAFAGYYYRHQHFVYSFNGLASGNHIVEARLHGLYELIECDTLARLSAAGQVHLEDCDVIKVAAPTDTGDLVASLWEMIRRAGLELFLLRAPSPCPPTRSWRSSSIRRRSATHRP